MRVLFTTQPGNTVLNTMVPLAWALRAAGHDVRVAAKPKFADVITQAGLTAVPVGRTHGGPDHDDDPEEPSYAAQWTVPPPFDVIERSAQDITWEKLKSRFDADHVTWDYKAENFPLIADLVAFARQWRPDLVIWEPFCPAGAIAAAAVGAAHARLLWSVDYFGVARDLYLRVKNQQPPGDRVDHLAGWLADYAAKYGGQFSEELVTGQVTIEQLPESLRMQADLEYVPMRYVPYGGPAVVPKWLTVPPERRRVGLTLGQSIIAERRDGYIVDLPDVLDSLSDLDIEIVATVADKERHKLGHIPDNTRLVPYVPLHALTATCAAVIHHAGIGTMVTTTLDGVPQLSLPWNSDQPALAHKLAEQGGGLTVPAFQATGAAVRENLLRLLHEPSFRERAGKLRDEMLAMPTPAEVVPQLEKLAAR
ncbi:glycosyltransferase (activator-dependent family) [Kibdelosporangium banguiense]|uniref:Glycosyltransferase (Activator-dependent family) n=1 Tax=Kibdelosporangium banguiense TaxID=1365924 RepID=A0ABS4TZE7_9PSEU|nr:activator-dependent family glycosyltransferase [Kibdelosporangium banguiense]MBP2329782.1 glycosyltransferase (activator-dependent family) [Kibdelosporangium banguiense]